MIIEYMSYEALPLHLLGDVAVFLSRKSLATRGVPWSGVEGGRVIVTLHHSSYSHGPHIPHG